MNPSRKRFRQDFVSVAEESNRSLVAESCVVARLGDERDQAFVNVGQGFSCVEHSHEGFEKIRRDFLCAFMKEFHGDAVMSGRLSFR